MRRALFAASLVALSFGVFCTTKDVDYDPAILNMQTGGTGATSSTATTTSSSSGGSSGTPTCDGTVCTPTTVEEALILDFDAGAAGAAGASGDPSTFGSFNDFSGGTFVYGDGFSSEVEDDAWHLSGNAGQSSGFGLYLSCESDASAYDGIEFTLWGNAGPGQINMLVETSSNIPDACQGGTCSGSCVGAAAAVIPPESATEPETYRFLWADFQDGAPDDTPDPSEITAIVWRFQASGNYAVDFYVDDIRFIEE